jgi:hypothetical protein
MGNQWYNAAKQKPPGKVPASPEDRELRLG